MYYKKIIILTIGIFILLISSCERFDIVRVMDTKTDSIAINSSKIIAYGTILDNGDRKIIQHGHCWSTNKEPDINDYSTELGEIQKRDTFISELNKIIPGVEHYIRSYIYDGKEYIYGNTIKFTVSADNVEFNIDSIRALTETNLLVSSSVQNIGSMNFEDYGHCWSQTDPPTINDPKSAFGPLDNNKAFTTAINNLNLGRYYIRGYLKSAGAVIYTNTVIFESRISVETGLIDAAQTEATAYGVIKSLGVEAIRDHGHCWSLQTSSPTLNNNHNSLGAISKLGTYSGQVNNLLPNQTYYIRAYATDGIHVFYGDVISFTTNQE